MSEDPLSRHILSGGYLYPCHALFLPGFGPSPMANATEVKFTAEAAAALKGLAEVISRVPGSAPLRYLTLSEVDELVAANVYHSSATARRSSAINVA